MSQQQAAQPSPPSADGAQVDDEHRYVVRVAPAVLATIIQRSAEQVPGVVRLATTAPRLKGWGGASVFTRGGLRLALHDGRARIALHLVIARGQNLQTVGSAVQAAVTQALENLLGMPVESVDIYVQDVG